MTLWDYLDAHPWLALMHGFALVFIILVSMHAAIGAIGIWFGTAKKLSDLEKAISWLTNNEHDTERMAAILGSVMMAMRDMDFTKKTEPQPESEE